jgi:hypothetical protein
VYPPEQALPLQDDEILAQRLGGDPELGGQPCRADLPLAVMALTGLIRPVLLGRSLVVVARGVGDAWRTRRHQRRHLLSQRVRKKILNHGEQGAGLQHQAVAETPRSF